MHHFINAGLIIFVLALVTPTQASLKHMRVSGRGPKDKRLDDATNTPIKHGECPFATNGTCHAGSITKDNYACGSGCGLCAPLADSGCRRPCGVWTLKLRGTGGKFIRENVMLALFEQLAVTQSEGDTLGHDPTAARLAEAKAMGGVRVIVLRNPVTRLISRYWFEGRFDQSSKLSKTDARARSFESWLEKIRGKSRGTRVWSCASNYFVKVYTRSRP
jgi:hypothetical protein